MYTVRVIPAGGGTGGVQLTLWSDLTDALTIGTPQPQTIQFREQQVRLPFDGTAGQNLRIGLTGATLPESSTLHVVRPDGSGPWATIFGAAGITADIPTLTSSGIHTVRVIPSGSGTGNVTVNVFNR